LPRTALAVFALAVAAGPASGRIPDWFHFCHRDQIADLNRRLAGRLLDHTSNHRRDNRLFSPALGEKRSVYVYLPPGYDGTTPFPAALWLHGFGQDERSFLDLVPEFDRAIATGRIPPLVIAAPDGSVRGRVSLFNSGSFYVNSRAGRYADYIVQDVWHGFVRRHFRVRPERDAHLLAGASMGGFGAYHLGFTHKGEFAHLIGIFPPVDLTYADCRGRYLSDYDPFCRGVRTVFPRNEIVGRFYGVVLVRSRRLTDPLVGRRTDLDERSAFVRQINPADLLEACDVRPGEFNLFLGYGTRDEFNLDAQVQSFAEKCHRRGVRPDVFVVPGGKHNIDTGKALFGPLTRWTMEKLGAFTPPGYAPVSAGAPVGRTP
jgi:S-formylglutathione hydrolase FrmB